MTMVRSTLLILTLAMFTSCGTLNRGVDQPERFRVELKAPVGTGFNGPAVFGGCPATFSLQIFGGKGPFEVDWDFGGAAENTISTVAEPGSGSVSVNLVDVSTAVTFLVTVHVSDSIGNTVSDTIQFSIAVSENRAPTIDSLTYSDGVISVSGYDYGNCFGDSEQLTFTAYVDDGNISAGPAFDVTDTSARFMVNALDILAGAEFSVTVTAHDGSGGTTSESISGSIEPFLLAFDTLYAIATSDRASAGGNVRIIIATGHTSNPFQYLNGCGVVCENGASYLPGSFDVGDPDDTPDVGSANPIDGVWADMGATSFLLAPDNFITGTDLGDGTSRTDFNVTPLGGNDIHATGILFNFEYTFASAGTYTLGFEAVNVVSRTYYQDSSASTDYFWSDISNLHPYNTIVVD